ncbi:LruC domain-containing protein [Mucilaginibacter gotjawali]|uniref:LruC domain-containing protein n=2 Tax=Mucilaginibacter gotjawali TaxID=1550579 RepID=A0A839SNT8_9SPHI|nr:LruC domain-containing protein [Mucilaginibacter gotjawali]MBB3058159.1 LruC domain-containing protein [Mucilaginibacter gotjawali]BAU54886.1 hypothetical protein MgSA37_03065 [Mucilaginibacter gotjawali]
MKKLIFPLICLTVLIASCKKQGFNSNTTTTTTTVDTLNSISPAGFDFKTTKTVSITVSLASGANEPIASVPVNIYSSDATITDPLLTAMTDATGTLHAQVELPAYMDTVIIDAKYIGLMRNAKAVISNNSVNAIIGGPKGFGGSVVASNFVTLGDIKNRQFTMRSLNSFNSMASTDNTQYIPMGAWDGSGVPKYLTTSDAISAQLLSYLNASLPETVDVRKLHPEYLTSSATSDLVVTATADVWVTFVSEGAGYLNSLGYYTYPTNNPPKSASDVTKIYYMFPNASLPGSGGGLNSGSKVKLGTFNAGTSIGFVLLSNAFSYSGNGTINTSGYKFFSTTACNPETDAALKRHTVLLSTPQNVFCIGFEDMFRQNSSCDHDFNDVIIYGSSNPVTAISTNGVQPIETPKDADGDGVPDNQDAFPNDPARAYVNYYPSKSTFGTLAFEDLWPSTGDYDMNDMVVGYQYKIVSNAKNLAVEMYANYVINASGASFVSGFGVQMPFSPNLVKSVTGQKIIGNYIKQNGNGTEAGQSKTVIIPFDNYNALIKRPGGYVINAQNGAPFMKSDTAKIYMSFTTPLSSSTLGSGPFNPFLISNQRRGYEVHLPNNAPTDLADKTLLGTSQDASNPGLGVYYKSKKSWPWALNFAGPFNYPTEGTNIGKAYTYFFQWAQSGGVLYPNWYLNTAANVNPLLIYSH